MYEDMKILEKMLLVNEWLHDWLSLFQRKLIVIDLSKLQVLGANPKAIRQINFTEKLNRVGDTYMIFFIEDVKEAIWDFSQGTVRVLQARRQTGGGGWGGGRRPPKSFLSMCPFFMSPVTVVFLKEVTKNVHENQYMSKLK